jgi:hypothetical protein
VKREDVDWSILIGAILTLGVSLAVGGLIVGVSFYFESKMEREFNANNALFQDISRRYLSVDEEEKLIKKFYPRFVELYEEGVIGREQRLNWLEILRAAGEYKRLPGLNYEIKSQSVYVPQFPAVLGRYQLYSSDMLLNMQLLHEVDLLDVLDFMDKNAQGLYSVSECRFSRAGQDITMTAHASNITTRCDLSWFTIKLADGTEIKV